MLTQAIPSLSRGDTAVSNVQQANSGNDLPIIALLEDWDHATISKYEDRDTPWE